MNDLLNRPAFAITLAIIGFAAFSFSDALTRFMVHGGYSVFAVAAMFQSVALLALLVAQKPLGGLKSVYQSKQIHLHSIRGVLIAILIPLNVYAFSILPFATTYTLLFTGSFWAILLARPLTGEHVPARKFLAVILGFMGALLVLRPWQDAFDWRMLIPIFSALCFATESLLARRFSENETPLSLAIFPTIFCIIVTSVIAGIFKEQIVPEIPDIPFILVGGAMMGIGFLCVPLAFRYANASVVGPFHYTQLIWAAIIGAVFFNELPDIYTIIGGMLIVSGGIMALLAARRESP